MRRTFWKGWTELHSESTFPKSHAKQRNLIEVKPFSQQQKHCQNAVPNEKLQMTNQNRVRISQSKTLTYVLSSAVKVNINAYGDSVVNAIICISPSPSPCITPLTMSNVTSHKIYYTTSRSRPFRLPNITLNHYHFSRHSAQCTFAGTLYKWEQAIAMTTVCSLLTVHRPSHRA